MRKALSLLLAVVMLVSCAPLAFAHDTANKAETVPVTGIEISKTSVSLRVGKKFLLYADVLPEDATDRSVEWSSSDEEVATVEFGRITAVAEGFAVITATTNDGGYSAKCMVYVQEDLITTIEVSDIWYPPTEGERCGDHKNATPAPDSDFVITDAKWYNDTEHRYMDDDEVFAYGKRYSIEFFLKANEGLYFDMNPDIKLNGGEVPYDPYSSADDDDCTVFFLWVKPFIIASPIERVDVTGVNLNVTAGDTAGNNMDIAFEGDVHFTIDHVFWFDDSEFVSLEDEDEFIYGHGYAMGFYLLADDGYKFTPETVITINGSEENVDKDFTYLLHDGLALDTWSIVVKAAGTAPVSGVTLNMSEASVGTNDTLTLKATVQPNDAADKSVTWSSSNEEVATVEDGVVTGISEGTAVITVTTNDGGFTATCKVTVTKKLVKEIEISDLCYPPVTGEKASDSMGYTIAPDSHFTVSSARWYCDTDHKMMEDDDVFEFGKKYSLNLNLKAEDEYIFDEEPELLLNNGNVESDIYSYTDPDDPTVYVLWTVPYIIADTIDSIVIEGVVYPPVIGMRAGDCMDISFAEDSHFTVNALKWNDDTLGKFMNDDDVFTEGHQYSFGIFLDADEGYKFDERTVITINGGDVEPADNYTYILSDGKKQVIWTESTEPVNAVPVTGIELDKTEVELKVGETLALNASVLPENASNKGVIWESSSAKVATVEDGVVTAHFCGTAQITATTLDGGFTASCTVTVENTVISNITITTTDMFPVPGDMAGAHLTYSIPEDAHFKINQSSWLDFSFFEELEDTDTFKPGHEYCVVFEAAADEGYIFDENTVISITGEDGEIDIIEPLLSEDGTIYRICTDAMLSDDGNVVRIDKIEVEMNLDIRAGQSVEDHLTCTVPEDARYSATVLYWVDVTGEKHELVTEGEFIEGHKYEVFIAFAAHEGCVFTDDVTVLLNGSEEHDPDVFTVTGSNILIASNDITAKPAVTIGDVNGDGKLNTADAVVVLKYAAEMIQLDENQLAAADTNHDGKVNTADAVLILKFAAGMITEF